MSEKRSLLKVQQQDDILILTPRTDLGEEHYQEILQHAEEVYQRLQQEPALKNVILDLGRIDYFGSTAIGFFIGLWKRISSRDGKMAICNLSDNGKMLLNCCGLDQVWPVFTLLDEAVANFKKEAC